MDLKSKRKELMGLVGGVGVVVALGGFVGGWYTVGTTIVLTFAVWIIGSLLVTLFTD